MHYRLLMLHQRRKRREQENLAVGMILSVATHALILIPFVVAMVEGGQSGRHAPQGQAPFSVTVGKPGKPEPKSQDTARAQLPQHKTPPSKRPLAFEPNRHDLLVTLYPPQPKKQDPQCGQRSAPARTRPSRPGSNAQTPIRRGKVRHRLQARTPDRGFHRSRKNQDVRSRAQTPNNNIGNRRARSDGVARKALVGLKLRKPEDLLTRGLITRLVKYYYHHYGEWAGQYRLRYIAKLRLERRTAARILAHVRYRYDCGISHCSGALQQGFDQRIFYLSFVNKRWIVTRMGGHMSARLSP